MELLAQRCARLGLSPQWLLERDAPGGLRSPGLVSANGHCHLLRCGDGWAAINLAREDDRDVLPALVEGGSSLADVAAGMPAIEFRNRAAQLQLPVAVLGEAAPAALAEPGPIRVPRRVLDLSALWAGPLCAALLARSGAEVLRIESIGRPDPTPLSSPLLDTKLNGAKERLPLDLRSEAGRARLHAEIARADVIVTSGRAAALARLGLEPARFPDRTWVAITGHGFSSTRVGFGDDCAVAGGLVDRQGSEPRFRGDALADPLTGLEAALSVLSGCRGLIDMAMAGVAASYAAAS